MYSTLMQLSRYNYAFAVHSTWFSKPTISSSDTFRSTRTKAKNTELASYICVHIGRTATLLYPLMGIERIHSRLQQPCKFIGTKESVYRRKELNFHRIGLVHQHGRRFIVLEHQFGCLDVMCIRSINEGILQYTFVGVDRRGCVTHRG